MVSCNKSIDCDPDCLAVPPVSSLNHPALCRSRPMAYTSTLQLLYPLWHGSHNRVISTVPILCRCMYAGTLRCGTVRRGGAEEQRSLVTEKIHRRVTGRADTLFLIGVSPYQVYRALGYIRNATTVSAFSIKASQTGIQDTISRMLWASCGQR